MVWQPSHFDLAYPTGPYRVAGYVYNGLGLHQAIGASPKGKRPPTWTLTHLGSGHRVASIKGTVADAFPVATEIAEAGDWTFDGLYGWRNQFPDAFERVKEIIARHAKRAKLGARGGACEEVAQQIALARAQ